MNKFLLITILIICISCKFTKNPPTDKEFIKYRDKFEELYRHPVNIPIYFEDLKDNVVGVCLTYNNAINRIKIDPKYWSNLSEYQRELLIFHKLGHCVLGEDHNDKHFNDGCPKSIMNSYLFNWWEVEYCYIPDYDYYINELFN